ncbi:MAG: alpha-L-fucosidase [Clostridia bacterium]|nr:alpha-L-fucosidase [Clostridia bacterium]
MSDLSEATSQHEIIGYTNSGVPFERTTNPDAQWFFDPTQLGLFIHFGISTVHGDCDISWGMMDNPERKAKGNGWLTPYDYWKQAEVFDPKKFEPERWLSAVKEAGFSYAVFTTRHHDGYAMWPSDAGDFSTKQYMHGRDLVGEYVTACRAVGLKVGLYYSPPDWHFNQKYMSFMVGSRSEKYPDRPNKDIYHNPIGDIPGMPADHYDSYTKYVNAQVTELLTRYGKIDILWFDGSMKDTSKIITIDEIRALQPSIVVNDRLWGVGDYNTKYECYLPSERPTAKYWEACECWHVGGGWSYVKNADKFRSLDYMTEHYSIVKKFGGNYLPNIAPDRDGAVPEGFYAACREFGEQIKEI